MPAALLNENLCLDYEAFGAKESGLVVLISGAGAPAKFWPQEFCKQLASDGFYVVRYCHRDTGHSSHFDTPYDIHELLSDLAGLIDKFDHKKAHLVGHSMGGYLAQLAMCEFPDRLETATSISAGSAVSEKSHEKLGTSLPRPEVWNVLMQNEPTGDFMTDLPGWLESWIFLNGSRMFDEALATNYTRALYDDDPRNAQVATNHIYAMGTVPDSLIRRLPHSQVPLLVLHGTEDPLVPIDNGQATSQLAKTSTFCRLENAGHMFFNHNTWNEIRTRLVTHLA